MTEPSCLVNCTIPVKLRDFLKENGINRSELFRKAALDMYEHQICPKCYSHDIIDSYKGKICRDCNKWLVQKACSNCDVLYTPDRHGTPYKDTIICNDCFTTEQEGLEDWFAKELSKGDKDE